MLHFERLSMSSNKKKPTPFDYIDPGEYLVVAYNFAKKQDSGLSHRYLASHMGYKSPAAFHDIIKGRVFPSSKAFLSLKDVFKLDDSELEYLVLLFIANGINDSFCHEIMLANVKKVHSPIS
jgi:hypothetical protein